MKKRQESNLVARFWTKQSDESGGFGLFVFSMMEKSVGKAVWGRK